MVFTLWEVVQAIIMTGIVGWIFKDVFQPKSDPDSMLKHMRTGTYGWHAWAWAALLVAPAIILHELGHKFVALGFGLTAEFHAAWTWLALGIIMKLIGGFIFFVPAFVAVSGSPSEWVMALIALAGPLVNFALWGFAKIAPDLRKYFRGKKIKMKELQYWVLFARINLFLGIFNMIPIPGFDGFQFFVNVFKALF